MEHGNEVVCVLLQMVLNLFFFKPTYYGLCLSSTMDY